MGTNPNRRWEFWQAMTSSRRRTLFLSFVLAVILVPTEIISLSFSEEPRGYYGLVKMSKAAAALCIVLGTAFRFNGSIRDSHSRGRWGGVFSE